jgi:hypothetical protein
VLTEQGGRLSPNVSQPTRSLNKTAILRSATCYDPHLPTETDVTDKPAVEDTFELNMDDFPCDLPGGNDDIVVEMSPIDREQFASMELARTRARVQRRSKIKR